MIKRLFLLLFFSSSLAEAHNQPMKIVTTFSILGDFVKSIGKDKVVISIVGPNSDSHLYEPKPKDVRHITHADLVFVNGLGFEGWIDRLIESSGYHGELIVATEGIKPRLLPLEGAIMVADPHAWHNVKNVEIYVGNILKALVKIDPTNRAFYEKNAEAYLAELRQLDQWIVSEFSKLKPQQRKIITAHDAFGYFGDRYGITLLAPVGISTMAEPTGQGMVSLIREIKNQGIKTIFVENISNPHVIHQLAEETGAHVGAVIYSDALSNPGEGGATYLELMHHNVEHFVKAMRDITPT